MRIATWNVNGLRAALRKGFYQQLTRFKPDVLMLQEVRALPEQLPKNRANPRNWHVLWHPAEKLGYSGTAIWSQYPIEELGRGIGDSDTEGRVIHARIKGIHIVSVYLPSGSSGDHRQAAKEAWMPRFRKWLDPLCKLNEPVIIGGDFNIAHTERDIFHARSNEKTSGFLPHERAWIADLFDSGWHDLIREHVGDCDGPYTWWSNRGAAREKDRGWRIDYLLANKVARNGFAKAKIDRHAGLKCSDHAPVIADFDIQ